MTVVRRASCGLQRAAGIRVAREQAPLRWLSLGRWRNTRACRARATCRAGCDRFTHYGDTLRWRKPSHPRCKTVVRRASCGLQHRTAGFRMARARAPLRRLSLGRWQNTRACRARASCCASCGWFASYGRLTHLKGYCTGGRPPSFDARPWCDVRALASNAQPTFAWHARKPHFGGCVSAGSEFRELATRARRATLVSVVLRTM